MSNFFKIYNRILLRYPMLSQSVQTGILMGVGDVIAQIVVDKQPISKVDYKRTFRFFTIGVVATGPVLTGWYTLLSKTIGGDNKGENGAKSTNRSIMVLKKVALDQLVFSPFGIVFFMSLICLAGGKSVEDTKQDIRLKFWDILITNWYIWPFVQLGNFYFVPLRFQVLVVQVVALFWNTYFSWKTHHKES